MKEVPLDFSKGTSAAQHLQRRLARRADLRAFVELRVVKALNTCNCEVMIAPTRLPAEHDLFICDNDASAKAQVARLLREFTNARATGQLIPLWIRLFTPWKTPFFNFRWVRV